MTSPRVVVLDYGSGNLRSAERALARVGAKVVVTDDAGQAASCDALVVPGVGAFAACMDGIRRVGGDTVVKTRVGAGRPVLGICVGMQVLYDSGREHGEETAGIGVVTGRVERLRADILPHMGWNTLRPSAGSALFAGIGDERFYFVHSYGVAPTGGAGETVAVHGSEFVAAVERPGLAATQFHPEKSGDAGLHLLENWLRTLR